MELRHQLEALKTFSDGMREKTDEKSGVVLTPNLVRQLTSAIDDLWKTYVAQANLVKRLREGEKIPRVYVTTNTQMVSQDLLDEAADRIEKLEDAIQWVITDSAYKAPEQAVEAGKLWITRLRDAIDG